MFYSFKSTNRFIALLSALFLSYGISNSFALDPNESNNASLSGFIRDSLSEETIIGATVFLDGTKKGAYTNKSGYFSIQSIPPGEYTVKVSSIGYKPITKKIKFSISENRRENFFLANHSVRTEEVTVTAHRDVEKRQISISKVNVPVDQIKEIRVGGESDLFRTLQMLPGVLTSSQLSSGLFIRGGSPDQNLILLDGMTVYNPSHLFGFISTFNSEAIKDVELIKGGYPAEFGSRMSAVLNITQKDGNKNEIDGLVSLGLISSKVSLEGPLPLFDGTWFLGARRTYFDLIAPVLDTDPKNPLPDFGFYDLNGKISLNLSQNDKLTFSGFLSDDDFVFEGAGIKTSLFLGNQAGAIKWTHLFSEDLFSDFLFSSSRYNNGLINDISGYLITIENSITDYALKGNLEWFASDQITAKTGFEITSYRFSYERNFTGDDTESQNGTNDGGRLYLIEHDWTYSYYAQMNYQINELLSLQAGARTNFWDESEQLTIDPRFAFRYQFQEDVALKATWGIFHQYLRLAGDDVFTLFDTWLPTDKTVEPSKATHYILSLETKPWEGYDLNFDIYYKDLANISEVKQTSFEGENVSDVFFNGKGEAYGFEAFLQKRFGNFSGWIGYAFGFVNARFDSINGGNEFRPRYDRRHDFKFVGQYKLNDDWDFGATFMFQSGQSYTGATSRFQITLPGQINGSGHVVPSERFGLRLPPSHQLNLYAAYNTTFFELPAKIILDVYNVYSRRDILSRFYNTEDPITTVEDLRLLPILPSVSFEVRF